MEYRRLGSSGIKVSELSFGSWLTFGHQLDVHAAKECMSYAFDHGVNFFDNAEVYGKGKAEEVMGHVIKTFNRDEIVISTKIFWGGEGINQKGLSWKHLVEGTKASLKRLDLEYVDILFCHRPDFQTSIEESVRAIDTLIKQGLVFYWGTSEWPAERIREAHRFAQSSGCIPPIVEQPQYNLFARERVEEEYKPLFEEFRMGTTTWSPLASGILTGKYQNSFPEKSRLAENEWLREKLTPEVKDCVNKLKGIANDLGISLSQLAIAWCLKNPNVSTVILGASSKEQLVQNLSALKVKSLLTPEVMNKIDEVSAVG
jgi:voltage-dependent potassium channel beta subunit